MLNITRIYRKGFLFHFSLMTLVAAEVSHPVAVQQPSCWLYQGPCGKVKYVATAIQLKYKIHKIFITNYSLTCPYYTSLIITLINYILESFIS